MDLSLYSFLLNHSGLNTWLLELKKKNECPATKIALLLLNISLNLTLFSYNEVSYDTEEIQREEID